MARAACDLRADILRGWSACGGHHDHHVPMTRDDASLRSLHLSQSSQCYWPGLTRHWPHSLTRLLSAIRTSSLVTAPRPLCTIPGPMPGSASAPDPSNPRPRPSPESDEERSKASQAGLGAVLMLRRETGEVQFEERMTGDFIASSHWSLVSMSRVSCVTTRYMSRDTCDLGMCPMSYLSSDLL